MHAIQTIIKPALGFLKYRQYPDQNNPIVPNFNLTPLVTIGNAGCKNIANKSNTLRTVTIVRIYFLAATKPWSAAPALPGRDFCWMAVFVVQDQ